MKKRGLSLFLVLALCLTLLPAPVWAEGDAPEDGSGTSTENAVAEVTIGETTTQYTDLNTAFTAASEVSSATLKLLADVETAYAYTVSSGPHTLDLNGKTLTSTTTDEGFLHINGGTLTIQDSASGGAIKSVNSTLRVNSGGELTVTGGSFTSQNTNALYVDGGSAQLSGGTFKSEKDPHSIWVVNGEAANLLVSGYRYMNADDTTQKSSYSDGGENGVKGATTVCAIPEGEVTFIGDDGKEQTQTGCTEITAKTDDISHGWYVLKENVTVSLLNISEEVNVILCDGATLTVTSYLNVGQDSTLKLYWQSAGSGKLTAASIGVMGSVTAPAGGMKQTTGEGGTTTFEKCFEHDWEYTDNGNGTHKTTCALCEADGGTAPHSFDTYKSNDANGHTYACDCGAKKTEAHDLSYVITSKTHKQECSVCGYETAEAAHVFDPTTGKCVCGADQDVAMEKVAVTITAPDGTVTTTNYTDLIEAFKAADTAQAKTVEVTLLQNGKTYTLDSAELYPIEFKHTNGVEVIVDLNGCTLKRSVPNSGYGILKVDKGNVTFQNGTLELNDSASAAQAIKLLATGNKPTLTLENMTVKAAQGYAIYAENGTLYIKSGTYGEVLINGYFTTAKLSGGSYDSIIYYYDNGESYANLLETGYIFADKGGKYIDPSTMSYEADKDQNTKNIKVIPCTHKDASGASLFESGKCKQCGLTCEHKNVGTDGKCTVCQMQFVAQDSNGKCYASMDEAFRGVADGVTVTMLTDDQLAFPLFVLDNENKEWSGKSVKLVMDGKKLSRDTNTPALVVASGKLTIEDKATISHSCEDEDPEAAVSVLGGTLELKQPATITGGLKVWSFTDGNDKKHIGTLEGGLPVDTVITKTGANGNYFSVSVEGSENYTQVRELLPEGYAFAAYDAATGKAGDIVPGNVVKLTDDVIVVEHTHSFDADGKCACGAVCPHTSIGTDGKCTDCQQQMVAKADGKYYTTLTSAIAGADGAEITLIAAFQEPVTVEDGTTAVINLGDSLWTAGKMAPALTINGGNVTLKNGKLAQGGTKSNTAAVAIRLDGGALTVESTVTEIAGGSTSSMQNDAIKLNSGTLNLLGDTLLNGGLLVNMQNSSAEKLTAGKFTNSSSVTTSRVHVSGTDDKTVFDLLAEGYAFAKYNADGTAGDFVTASDLRNETSAIYFDVAVVKCTHKNGDKSLIEMNGSTGTCKACGFTCSAHEFEKGVCKNCGYACPHEHVTETKDAEGHTSASCDVCKVSMAVKVTSGGTTTYYAQMHYTYNGVDYDNTLKTILNGADGKSDGYAENGSTITLLTDGLNANAVVNNSRSITLDLNGKKLIETDGIRVEVGSTLTVTGEGSSSEDDNYMWPCVFNVQGGTLMFNAAEFGGTFNSIRVGNDYKTGTPGTLTSARDMEDAVKIGTLEIGSADAKVSFKQGTFGKIVFDVNSGSVTLGKLLGMWKSRNEAGEPIDVRSGNAFQNANGEFLRYDTKITKDKPLENVKLVGCDHDSVTDGTCDYCWTEHLVAARINKSGSKGNYVAESGDEADIKRMIYYALTGWGKSHGGTLKLFRDISLDGIQFEEGSEAGSITITYAYADGIDLNGHAITGGTLTLGKDSDGKGTNVAIKDSSANKGSISTPITVNGGATLTVEGVSVGMITAAGKTADGKSPSITLKPGTKFRALDMSGTYSEGSSGLVIADCLEPGSYLVNSDGKADSNSLNCVSIYTAFRVEKIKGTVTADTKTGSVPYHGNVPEALRPSVTMSDGSTPSLSYTWYYRTGSRAGEFPATEPNVGDTLNAFCVITAKDENNSILWETAVTGYTLTVGAADLKDAAVTVNNADSLIFTPDENGVGQTQTLDFTVTYNGSTLKQGTDYEIVTGSDTAANAGKHTLTLQGKGNYTGTLEHKWTIQPRMLGGTSKLTKTYDGTTALPKTITFSDFNTAADITLTEGTDYTVTGQYDSAAAGKRTADLTVTLTNNNYTFRDGMTATIKAQNSASISKAPAPQVTERGSITIYYDRSGAAYTFDLNDLLPALDSGKNYGELKDASVSSTLPSDYSFSCNLDQSLKLNLNVSKVPSSGEDEELGTFTFTLKFENYEDIVLHVDVNVRNRLTPTGAPTLSANEITYGDAVSSISLSGALKYDDKDVTGTFAWTDGTIKPNAGSYEAEWTFAPNDTIYAEVTGKTPITVKHAVVTVTGITVKDKTYDGSTAAEVNSRGTLSGAVGGDTLGYTVDAVFVDKNAGESKQVNLTVTLTGDKADNYQLASDSQKTTAATIKVKEITLVGRVSGIDRAYEANNCVVDLGSTGLKFEGLVDGEFMTPMVKVTGTVETPDAGENKPVTYTVEMDVAQGVNASNYKLISKPEATVTIRKAASSVSVAPTAKALTYNGSAQELVTAGTTADGTMVYSLSENGTYNADIPTGTNADTYTVWYKVKGDGNHNDSTPESVEATIAKAQVTITAKDKSAYVGSTAPDLTKPELDKDYTVSGLIGEDQLTTPPTLKYVDADGKEIVPDMTKTGETLIRVDGKQSDNYVIVYVDGKLTVTSRPSSGGSSSGSTTYTITVDKTKNGDVTVSPKSAAKGDTVTITVTPDKGYTLEAITVTDKDGKEIKLTAKDGKYTFTMPSGKVTVKATFMDDNTMLNFFVDVKADDYFYDAVKWAAEKGITSGTDATHFSPKAACTRAQIVTFLWRAAGSPEPKNMSSFTDVPADSYYAKAVAWAAENGITGGTGDGQFSPDSTCTREQAVAFLYRASGSPAVSGGSAFSDVAAAAYYANAVAWAEKNGVTGGIGNGKFGTGNDCTRAQIVTFLYRTYQGK